MEGALPPAAREKYQELQDLQDEAEGVVARKQRAESRLHDAVEALGALEELDGETTVFRRVGEVRIETTADDVEADLEARVDALGDEIEELEATEAELQEEFEHRKRDIKHLLGGPTGPVAQSDTDGRDE